VRFILGRINRFRVRFCM